MKISVNNKNILREEIIKLSKDATESNKIMLNKDVLDCLLFETVILDKDKDIKVKLPVWSGDFLRKIDLSTVDFTDVSWSILDKDIKNFYFIEFDDIDFSNNVYQEIDKIRESKVKDKIYNYVIDYSNTNAKIDLTKSFEAIHGKYIELRECNFANLDFSYLDLNGITGLYLTNVDISNTKMVIPNDIILNGNNSNLTNVDLSGREIDAKNYFDNSREELFNCNLYDTGININIDRKYYRDKRFIDNISMTIGKNWAGCFINNNMISSNDKKLIFSKKRKTYTKREK